MEPETIKKALISSIDSVSARIKDFCYRPSSDFTRKRKISVDSIISGLLGMEGKSLSNEMIDMFDNNTSLPTTSAFIQQRNKLKPEALQAVFKEFMSKVSIYSESEMVTLAVDGSEIRIPDNPDDTLTRLPGASNAGPYNSLHLNALYNLQKNVYVEAEIQNGAHKNENLALQHMVDQSEIPVALVIADRGYESYNNLAHIQEKKWFYLIRIKDGNCGIKNGLSLPASDEYDEVFNLKLIRKQTNEIKKLLKDKNSYRYIASTTPFDYLPTKSCKKDPTVFYTLNFRIVRFKISDETYETVITNLPQDAYSKDNLKKLYASRWGIETSFRSLKYTLGLLKFHSIKAMCIRQEIYAKVIMYNFIDMITSHVVISTKERKYIYKANFSTAAHICRKFLLGKTTSPVLESVISSFLIPIRPNRHRDRFAKSGAKQGFFYRVA